MGFLFDLFLDSARAFQDAEVQEALTRKLLEQRRQFSEYLDRSRREGDDRNERIARKNKEEQGRAAVTAAIQNQQEHDEVCALLKLKGKQSNFRDKNSHPHVFLLS
jgi:16S rRNA U516 pseudouridylate synthase RsuA-like enzyme